MGMTIGVASRGTNLNLDLKMVLYIETEVLLTN